jgi:hemolysin activation/secretion protein
LKPLKCRKQVLSLQFLCWFTPAGLVAISSTVLSAPWASAQSLEDIAQSPSPTVNIDVPRNPNSIEQILPTPPSPLPVEPPSPSPSPELETIPRTSPAEPPAPNLSQFPLEKVEILGSPVLHPVLQGVPEENQQTKEAIASLIQQSSCDIITPSLNALSGLRSETSQLFVPLNSCDVTFDDLIRLRTAITMLYASNGYVTSGAFLLANQDLDRRVVQIQVVEGELERVDVCLLSNRSREDRTEIEPPEELSSNASSASEPNALPVPLSEASSRCGSARLQDRYVRSRLNLADSVPLSQFRIERALQLLQLDPLVEQVNAELTAGSSPGQNVLQVRLREAPPLGVELLADNYQSPSIGSYQVGISASYTNILGVGDRLSAQYGITEGLDLYDVGYSIPVNPREGTLTLRYGNNNSNIVTDDFADLGIRSEAETFSVGFRQPLERTPTTEFALGLGVDIRRSQTFILDDRPFSFSEGAEEGQSRVTAIRFSQDWVNRGRRQVLAARSQFSLGINAFDATVNDSGTDGQFLAWLGQFQYVQQISAARMLLVTRLNAQLTPDSLLSLERFSFGGVESVRGYAQNQVVADNGVFGSVELRIPLTDDPGRLQVVPFAEGGYAWNNKTIDPPDDFIAGVGLGIRWQPIPDLSIRVDYGIPLTDVEAGNSLQENGVYFSVRYQPF